MNRARQMAFVTAASLAASLPLTCISRAQEQPAQATAPFSRAPVSKEVLRVQLPRPAVIKLPSGLTLLLLENHKLPTVAFSVQIRPGQLADPQDLPGLAQFTAAMLKEGTARRSSSEIASEIDSLGATLNASSAFGVSYSTVSASGLVDSAPRILDLLSDVILHPSFSSEELAKYKQRELATLDQQLSSPGFLANQTMRRVLYGSFPAAITSPTKSSLDKVSSEDLKRFHDQHYVPGNGILAAVGDFQTAEMRALIEKYFGAWSGAAEPSLHLPSIPEHKDSAITLVDRPGSVQTIIFAGDTAIRRTDPEYYNLTVMNEVLGAGPQSRLFMDLREVHGYTYGAYSNFNAEIYPGAWTASAPVRTAVTGGSMTQMIYEFKRINNEPVSEQDLDQAKRGIVGRFALSLENPNQLLGSWLTVQYFGLPSDYWDKYADHIVAVNAASVQAIARKFVDPAHLQWVCVGDAKQIKPVLEPFGPVSVVDVQGKPE